MSSSMPFTPRASSSKHHIPASGRFRATGATLSTREENKISHTLASVRKSRPTSSSFLQAHNEQDDNDDDEDIHPPLGPSSSRRAELRSGVVNGSSSSRRGKERELPSAADQSYSILPEHSFHSRPLSSRLAPPIPAFSPSKLSLSEEDSTQLHPRESQLLEVPLEVQEAMVLKDLLFVLLGIEGELITFDPAYDPTVETCRMEGPGWVVDSGLDPSLSSVLRRVLPLATYYMGVEAFIDSRCLLEFGKVNHALGSGLRGMLQEYNVLLTQLETLFLTSPTFTLQKAFFHLHPTIHTLSLLHALTNQLFRADEDEDDGSEDDESEVDEEERKLGLGGDVLKELDVVGGGGLVKGGEVLGLIWQMGRNMSGDPTANSLFSTLLLHASQPYAEMLIDWISSGHLTDKYEEFMVKEATSITKKQLDLDFTDEYWERRYTLRDGTSMAQSLSGQAPTRSGVPPPRRTTVGTSDPRLPGGACVPRFLEPWKHKILLAGKYLNVIRECGVDDREGRELVLGSWANGEGGMVDLEDEKFHLRIEAAYIHANRTLLKMLIEEEDLLAHLRSLKHHFFLSQSAFITQFLDASLPELAKSSKNASLVKLQSLLELSLRTSGGPLAENHGDKVKVVMANERLYDFLSKVVNQNGDINEGRGGGGDGAVGSGSARSGKVEAEKKKDLIAFEAFQLDYTVKFPVSLVISRKTIARYQVLFRFLLQLKHAELQLSRMWTDHTTPEWRTRTSSPEFEAWKLRVFTLRAKMMAYVQQMLAFVTSEVLEPNWRELEEKLRKVETVDQMLSDHVAFLDTCLKEAALTRSELIELSAKLISVVVNFNHHTKGLNLAAQKGFEAAKLIASGELEVDEKSQERFDGVRKWEKNFDHNLKVQIETVTFYGGSDNTGLLPLVVRLNSLVRG
ncbi:Spc98 family-domain-containing protein [Mrakia frigida]|uniref:gamma-tubulin-complex subunit SPC97 n=1 Tax=Mrakia frigida TaxID=29902 RepID=UPI003FCBF338